jgi:hypothetical protein
VGNVVFERVIGKYGVPVVNESGERLLDMCLANGMSVGNTWFRKKDKAKYTWVRVIDGEVTERALMDYVVVSERMVGKQLLDVNVMRGVAGGISDHFLVVAKVRVAGRWVKQQREEGERSVVKVWKLNDVERRREYEEKMSVMRRLGIVNVVVMKMNGRVSEKRF